MDENKSNDILVLENQECPVCTKKEAVFSEYETSDPFAGQIAIFTIKCNACGFKNSDLEFLEPKQPAEYKLEISCLEDLNIRVIKSGVCQIKIPNFRISVESTMNSEGFISNVEGVLNRFKKQIEFLKQDADLDKTKRKKIKNILKGLEQVFNGEKKITLKLIDETGNSAIISDKAEIKKIKKK